MCLNNRQAAPTLHFVGEYDFGFHSLLISIDKIYLVNSVCTIGDLSIVALQFDQFLVCFMVAFHL